MKDPRDAGRQPGLLALLPLQGARKAAIQREQLIPLEKYIENVRNSKDHDSRVVRLLEALDILVNLGHAKSLPAHLCSKLDKFLGELCGTSFRFVSIEGTAGFLGLKRKTPSLDMKREVTSLIVVMENGEPKLFGIPDSAPADFTITAPRETFNKIFTGELQRRLPQSRGAAVTVFSTLKSLYRIRTQGDDEIGIILSEGFALLMELQKNAGSEFQKVVLTGA